MQEMQAAQAPLVFRWAALKCWYSCIRKKIDVHPHIPWLIVTPLSNKQFSRSGTFAALSAVIDLGFLMLFVTSSSSFFMYARRVASALARFCSRLLMTCMAVVCVCMRYSKLWQSFSFARMSQRRCRYTLQQLVHVTVSTMMYTTPLVRILLHVKSWAVTLKVV